jgi:hypothetical protein
MAQTGSIVTAKVLSIMTDVNSGLNRSLSEISMIAGVSLSLLGGHQVLGQNVAADVAEKTAGATYPAIHVYCDKVVNSLREKFRTFSGKAHMTIEARVSQDRLYGTEQEMQYYIDAITQVLDGSRGDWGQGVFYTGGYEVVFGPEKHGGRNFVQIGKVTFEVDISTN